MCDQSTPPCWIKPIFLDRGQISVSSEADLLVAAACLVCSVATVLGCCSQSTEASASRRLQQPTSPHAIEHALQILGLHCPLTARCQQ